jgi:hypothetical protein
MINYYQDILEDAAKYHLLVNFHGATLPRGWQRTYPNLMTTEAVYGYEMITFGQKDADLAPVHMVMSAFARNAFDPMDFTPVSLYKIPRINRKTTSAFELATSVIFLSGIQHFAESPDGMAKMPAPVKKFMQDVPGSWDDVVFLDGYPGKSYAVARRSGRKWYVAAVNADTSLKEFVIKFSFLPSTRNGVMIYTKDDGQLGNSIYEASTTLQTVFILKPNDGFVMEFD